MIAPEPYLNAYLEVTKQVAVYTRSLSLENQRSLLKRISQKRAEQIVDLQDAIHVVLELLNAWERCDEPVLRKYLANYDTKWATAEDDFSMLKIFNTQLDKKIAPAS